MWQWSVSLMVSSYDTHLDSKRPGFDPLLRHRIFLDCVTYSTHCYILWPMWSPSSKHMRTCFLLGRVNVMVISVLGGLMLMTLTWIARDRGSIPCWGTEFFQIMSLIQPTVTYTVVTINTNCHNWDYYFHTTYIVYLLGKYLCVTLGN